MANVILVMRAVLLNEANESVNVSSYTYDFGTLRVGQQGVTRVQLWGDLWSQGVPRVITGHVRSTYPPSLVHLGGQGGG